MYNQHIGVSDELEYIDVKRVPVPEQPEGVFAAIIKRDPRYLWDNKLVYYSFTSQFSKSLSVLGVVFFLSKINR